MPRSPVRLCHTIRWTMPNIECTYTFNGFWLAIVGDTWPSPVRTKLNCAAERSECVPFTALIVGENNDNHFTWLDGFSNESASHSVAGYVCVCRCTANVPNFSCTLVVKTMTIIPRFVQFGQLSTNFYEQLFLSSLFFFEILFGRNARGLFQCQSFSFRWRSFFFLKNGADSTTFRKTSLGAPNHVMESQKLLRSPLSAHNFALDGKVMCVRLICKVCRVQVYCLLWCADWSDPRDCSIIRLRVIIRQVFELHLDNIHLVITCRNGRRRGEFNEAKQLFACSNRLDFARFFLQSPPHSARNHKKEKMNWQAGIRYRMYVIPSKRTMIESNDKIIFPITLFSMILPLFCPFPCISCNMLSATRQVERNESISSVELKRVQMNRSDIPWFMCVIWLHGCVCMCVRRIWTIHAKY